MNRRTTMPIWANFKARVSKIWNCITSCNPPAAVCNHLVGRNHSHWHRMIVGGVIMALGVIIAKAGGQVVESIFPYHIAHYSHYFFDMIGYLGHGVGAMPYLEALERFRSGE